MGQVGIEFTMCSDSGTKLMLRQNFLHRIMILAHDCVIMDISSLSMFLKLSTLDQYSSEFAYLSP